MGVKTTIITPIDTKPERTMNALESLIASHFGEVLSASGQNRTGMVAQEMSQ